jgi:hypothetical protein
MDNQEQQQGHPQEQTQDPLPEQEQRAASAEHEPELPLPPPTFEFFVLSMKMQAEMSLGLLRFSEETDAEPDLRAARHAIDLLAMIAEKTRGNLSMDEQRLLENSLTELRFRFVQAAEKRGKAQAE